MPFSENQQRWIDSARADEATTEPIFHIPENYYTLYPLDSRYKDVWLMYKKMAAGQWANEEIDFAKDLQSWEQLTNNERHFISHVLAFFAASDGIVLENLIENFLSQLKHPIIRTAYQFQAFMECIHSESYSLMLDTYIQDATEKSRLLNAITTMPTITKKAAWAIKWIGANVPYGLRLAAFSIVEGVFFSGSFCAIQWLNHRGKMPSLCQSNEFISRDENQHTELAAMLYGHIQNRVPRDIIEMMFREAVEIEKDFVCNALPVSLIEMNQALMCAHIEYTADYLLVQLGYPKIWNTPEPFDFMRLMTMSGKTNFFERGVTEYRKFGVGAEKVEDPFAPIDI